MDKQAPSHRDVEILAEDLAEQGQEVSNGATIGDNNLGSNDGGWRNRPLFDHGSARYAGHATSRNVSDNAGGADGRLSNRRRNLRLTELPPSGKERARILGIM